MSSAGGENPAPGTHPYRGYGFALGAATSFGVITTLARIAYDVNAIDQPLSDDALGRLVETARTLSGDATAIRALRQFRVERED